MELTDKAKQKFKSYDWRIDHLYTIVDKQGNKVRFKRNEAQLDFDKNKHTRNIILKSRQLGMTTKGVVTKFDKTFFTPNNSTLFIAHAVGEAENILANKIPVLWDNFRLQSMFTLENDKRGEFRVSRDDGSQSFIKVSSSGRSGTFNDVHITELAKMERMERAKAVEILTGTIPSVPITGSIDIESTAEGDIGFFHDLFMDAWERGRAPGPLEFKAHFYNWRWDISGIELVNKLQFRSENEMDMRDFFTERRIRFNLTPAELSYYYQMWLASNRDFNALMENYPITPEDAFRSTGNKFFDQQFLDLQVVREPIVVGDWKYYSKRDTSHVYVMGVDPSGGVGKDNAGIVVIDLTAGEIAAIYKSKWISPRQLAQEANIKGKLYNYAIIGVESNNHGLATLYELQNLNYPRIYSDQTYDRDKNEEKKSLGFNTNSRTKPLILLAGKEAINTFALRIPSGDLLRELRSYQREQLETVQVDEDLGHFDLVMAYCIAWHMRLHAPKSSKITRSEYA